MQKEKRRGKLRPSGTLYAGGALVRRLYLYLAQQLVIAFLFACVVVSFVVLFTQSFRLLSFVIDNSGTMLVFAQLMGLMIPTFLPLILPISYGIAVLFIYHKMAVDSEIVVMSSAGISPWRAALPALFLGALLIVFGGILTLWATPMANRAVVSLQYQVRDSFSVGMIRPGAFNDLDEGLTMFAQKRSGGGQLEKILLHDIRNPEKPVTIMAKTGLFSVENGAPQIVVFTGRRQELDVKTGRLQQLDFDRYVLDLRVLKGSKTARQADPREYSFVQLLKTNAQKGLSGKIEGRVRSEIHQRLAGPLLSLTFAMIGATVILVGSFNRRGMTKRVLLAALFIVVVQAAMIALIAEIGQSFWFVPLLYLITLAPVPVCFYLLRRETLLPLGVPFEKRWST